MCIRDSALGIVIRSGASTGGMDIPPLVLHHFFKIPVSMSLYVFDFIILSSQTLYNPLERLLYGIIPVSYTHLDVYKRQIQGYSLFTHPKEELIDLCNAINEKLMSINYSRFNGLDSDHYENFPILMDQSLSTLSLIHI